MRWAREIDLPVQINTTITRHNLDDFDNLVALMEKLDIVLWSVFFLVPTGRGASIDLISAEEFEQVFREALPDGATRFLRHQEHRGAALSPIPTPKKD